MNDLVKIAGIITLIVLLVVFGPLATIWALNTVFSLNIAYTFWTWLGTLVLQSLVVSRK